MAAESWCRRQVRDFAARRKVVNVSGEELPPFSITKAKGIVLQSDRYKKQIATDLRKYVVAQRGQFAFDPMSLYYGAIGLVRAADRGLISPDYVAFETDDSVDRAFLDYFLRSPEQVARYESVAETGNQFGKRRRVYWSVFEELEFSLPSLPEQRKIAAILSSVDEAIEGTQAVIEQLQVVKQAMMADLLTRGIPGRHKKFKQTEIGEVPEEWEVLALSDLVLSRPTNGKSPPAKLAPPGVPTFSIAAVRDGRVDIFGNLKYTNLSSAEISRYRLAEGDILVVRGNGNADLVGRCGVVRTCPEDCIYPDILMRVIPNNRIMRDYLVTVWNSDVVHDQILLKAKTTNGTYKVNQEDVASILVPVPSQDEQAQIGTVFLSLDETVTRTRGEFEQLGSLKSALMSVLLTGEVRVRVDEESAA
jgi:type I restriction enzyme S subunit